MSRILRITPLRPHNYVHITTALLSEGFAHWWSEWLRRRDTCWVTLPDHAWLRGDYVTHTIVTTPYKTPWWPQAFEMLLQHVNRKGNHP